jgi:hypothetical protein
MSFASLPSRYFTAWVVPLAPTVAQGSEEVHEDRSLATVRGPVHALLVRAAQLQLRPPGVLFDDLCFCSHPCVDLGPHLFLFLFYRVRRSRSARSLLDEGHERDDFSGVEPHAVSWAYIDEEGGASSETNPLHVFATMRTANEREERLTRELATGGEGNEVAKADGLACLFAGEELTEVVRSYEGPKTTSALLHVDGGHVERDPAERCSPAARARQVDGAAIRPSRTRDTARADFERRRNGTPTSQTGRDRRFGATRRARIGVGRTRPPAVEAIGSLRSGWSSGVTIGTGSHDSGS